MAYTRKYVFLNSGRAARKAQVEKALDIAFDPDAVTVLNEIAEGDKGYNERLLVRKALAATHQITHFKSKEPIAVPMGTKVKKTKRFWRGSGVKRQSPARTLHETWIDNGPGEPIEVAMSGHYYAGAMNGKRPRAIKKVLRALYRVMHAKHKRRIRKHHKAGRHVSWWMDTNWRKFPKLHKQEVEVFRAPPDYGRVIPAPGYGVKITNKWRKDQPIERHHDVHGATVRWYKKAR